MWGKPERCRQNIGQLQEYPVEQFRMLDPEQQQSTYTVIANNFGIIQQWRVEIDNIVANLNQINQNTQNQVDNLNKQKQQLINEVQQLTQQYQKLQMEMN